MHRKLAASFIVTMSLAACSSPAPEPETPTTNPPEIDIAAPDNTVAVEPIETMNPPPPEDEPTLADAPKERGRIMMDDAGQCSWTSSARANPPPPSREVRCPPVLTKQKTDPLFNATVFTEADGTCHVYERRQGGGCPPGARCNPPPPRRVDVACAGE